MEEDRNGRGRKKRGNDESPKISAQIELEAIKRQQIIITSCCQSRLIYPKKREPKRERMCTRGTFILFIYIYY